MEKIFDQKNLNNFIWSPLGSRGNIYINFCLQVHFQFSAAWYCSYYLPPVSMTPVANLPPVSLIPVAICHQRHWHRRQICHRYRWQWWQICHRCHQRKGNWWQNLPPVSLIPMGNNRNNIRLQTPAPCGAPWLATRKFSKKFEMILMLLSGAWGRWFMKKTWSKKSRDTVPLRIRKL